MDNTANIILAIGTAITSIIGAAAAAWVLIRVNIISRKVDKIEDHANGMRHALVAAVGSEQLEIGRAKGVKEEREETRAREKENQDDQ